MDVRVPTLAEGVESGTVVNVLVNVGDRVEKDQTLIELETEKAVAAIPAPQAGTVTKINVKRDDKVGIGQVILSLSEGAAGTGPAPGGNGHSRQQAVTDDVEAPPISQREAVARESARPAAARPAAPKPAPGAPLRRPTPLGIPVAASPSLRKMARDLGIDLNRVPGSEAGGRIVLDDVRAYIQHLQSLAEVEDLPGPAETTSAPARPKIELPDFAKWGAVEKKPMSTLRKKIAEKMSESASTVARVTQFDEVDITDLMQLRKKHEPSFQKAGTRLTMSAFAVKVVVDALKKHAAFNASLDLANEQIIFKSYYHVAMAVDTEQGLIVPVIKDADKKSLVEIAKEIDRLAAATRDRKIAVEDLQGGTFTISNQGSLGGTHFTPVVYTPQVAILGLGRARWQVVVQDGKTAQRLIMPMALSYDHRVVDGGNAVRFTNDLVQGFQNFDEGFIAPAAKAGAAPKKSPKAKKK
ncbi:MAG: 2-oxo acid dehydrogenase subunit E2 [Elusimicrobia bacterium]|nr:2-oxo acid dehydrogenase subunit E2 [Elusimicrobiota bacterium]